MSSSLTYENSSTRNLVYPINEETTNLNNIIIKNPVESSSSRYQSTVMNKYQNLIKSDLTDPISALKQINNLLLTSNQHSHLNTKYVCRTKF